MEVGPGVKDLKVGDRVALEPGTPCWANRVSRYGGLDSYYHFSVTATKK